MKDIILNQPFDAHMHWRELTTLMRLVAQYSIRQFSGGLLMPNTNPKIETFLLLKQYRKDTFNVIQSTRSKFLPIFTYYLSPDLTIEDLLLGWNWHEKLLAGVKYYPKGGTTGSDKGLSGFKEVIHILETMQRCGIPLLIHGETPDVNGEVVDDYERESIFLENECLELREQFPELKIVLEHITTTDAAQFTLDHKNTWATITPQHCLLDRRALSNGVEYNNNRTSYTLKKNGSFPSMMCRPILKDQKNLQGIQQALIFQAKNGLKKFGLGTDTAPHTKEKKYCECGACGVFSAPIALELYAMAFEQMGILDHLHVFACDVMPEFYGIKNHLPRKKILLKRIEQEVLSDYEGIVTPFFGQKIPWTATEVK